MKHTSTTYTCDVCGRDFDDRPKRPVAELSRPMLEASGFHGAALGSLIQVEIGFPVDIPGRGERSYVRPLDLCQRHREAIRKALL